MYPEILEDVLPDELSDTIILALAEERKCNRSPKYTVDMNEYHYPIFFGGLQKLNTCFVCFAGGIISQTLKCPINKSAGPYDFDLSTRNKLISLDDIRRGKIYTGMHNFYLGKRRINYNDSLSNWEVPEYGDSRLEFRKTMKRIAVFLKKEGY